jgi:hypothetical protein
VLASQVQQCFFIEDPFNKNRHYVLKAIPRETCDMGECLSSFGQDYDISTNHDVSKDDCEVDLVREDLPDEIFEIPLSELHKHEKMRVMMTQVLKVVTNVPLILVLVKQCLFRLCLSCLLPIC